MAKGAGGEGMKFKNGTICDKHNEIIRLVELCLEDGQKMEAGLEAKRDRIEALESEIEGLKLELEKAEAMIGRLQDENQDLAAELKAAQAGA